MPFRSGFVTIIGKPNAGKSTLLNALVGEKISIITPKAQTTRHRIKGILTGDNFQIVFSDTPGIIEPKYGLHKSMMKTVHDSLEDADVLLFLMDGTRPVDAVEALASQFKDAAAQKIIAVNKSDHMTAEQTQAFESALNTNFPASPAFFISALHKANIKELLEQIISLLPEQHAFYSTDELTDRSERFIVSELIREKIFGQFKQEIPYSAEVIITDWKEEKELTKIRAEIIVERETQKAIILGKGGAAIKQLGIEARKSVEGFLGTKIFLGLTVKVNAGWRNNERSLKYFGYDS